VFSPSHRSTEYTHSIMPHTMDDEDVQTIAMICAERVRQNRMAVNWLVGIAIFFIVIGIILQVVLGAWAWATIWVVGVILLLIAAVVYAAGASARDCFTSPTNPYCRLVVLG
jgi:hypothetical protein